MTQRCANASELYTAMLTCIRANGFMRESVDALSPQQKRVQEAAPCSSFTLVNHQHNVVGNQPVDLRWATANVLQFFTGTEDGRTLRSYNKHADRFLDKDEWIGAYGAAAMPGLRMCVDRMKRNPDSRRMVVSMGGLDGEENINLPRCISFLQFLKNRAYGMDLIVYQRSLNLSVMPYDCILLCNILEYTARSGGAVPYCVHWVIGSLHMNAEKFETVKNARNHGVLLPMNVLNDPAKCSSGLYNPDQLPEPFRTWLMEGAWT